jgi:hypothetical protein
MTGNITIASGSNSFQKTGTGWMWTSTGLAGGTQLGGVFNSGSSTYLCSGASIVTTQFQITSTGAVVFGTGTPSVAVNSTTDGTSGTAGAFNTLGGIGVTKAAWIGTNLTTGGKHTINVTSIVSAAGTTVISATDHSVIVTGSTTQTLTLAACATGRILYIKNRSSGNVTVNRAGSDTIDGGTSSTLTSNQSQILIGNGTDWTIN